MGTFGPKYALIKPVFIKKLMRKFAYLLKLQTE